MSRTTDFLQYGLGKAIRKLRSQIGARMNLAIDGETPDSKIDAAKAVASRYGVLMAANWRDKTFRYCIYATYGRDLSGYLAAIDQVFVFLDIGSNQGLYALLAAQNPNCRKVLAFEPVDRTYRLLRRNIALNRADPVVTALKLAISSESGTASIAIDDAHSGTATLVADRTAAAAGAQQIRTINAAELDKHIPEGLPIIIKIDVEGFEEVVIAELAKSAHLGNIMAIFFEVDSRWSDAESMMATLRDAGFGHFTKFGRGHHYDVLAYRSLQWQPTSTNA